ncbi:MAG TPA: hypothetical protein VF466_04530 [Candidatus Saccharimonadales bacterium]
MFKHKRFVATLVAGFGLAVLAMGTAVAQNVTQGYQASGDLQNGMVVRLKQGAPGTVIALKQSEETQMFGLVVASADATLSLSSGQTQVYVATFGQYPALVNTQNGPIHAGDQLVISSVSGVSMKADTKHQVLIGKALQSFADGSNAEGHVKLSDGTEAAVGRIMVDIGVTRNPTYSGDVAAGVPHVLVSIAHAVTNKPLTALRLYGSLVALFVAFVVAGAILYAGIRTSMNSIGRNPLAKKSILRNLITVILTSLVVVFIGLIAVYLLLKI